MSVFKKLFKQSKQLNQTTRLYSLYGENQNLTYLENKISGFPSKQYVDNQDTALSNKIAEVKNQVDNLPTSGVSKSYVDTQDNALDNKISTNRSNITNLYRKTDEINTRVDNVANKANMNASNISSIQKNVALLNGISNQEWTSSNVFLNSSVFSGTTTFDTNINMFGRKINQVGNPTDNGDAANKAYVDGKVNEISAFSIYSGTQITTQQPDTWNDAYWRYFHYPVSQFTSNISVPNKIKPGNYVMNVCWIIEFTNGVKHRISTSIYYENLAGGQSIVFNPQHIGCFIAPISFGYPTKVKVHSIIGVREP